jgi:hypothetical protein
MAPSNEELMEQAEHARSSFDRSVAMTMAIIAAVLAWVTMMSHRAHNETLMLQNDSNRMRTEANIFHTRASDQWNYYQAKKIRTYQTQAYLEILPLIAKGPSSDSTKNSANLTGQWSAQLRKYETELPQLQSQAEALAKKAQELEASAEEKLKESHHVHERAYRYDLSELGVEIALVLCSLAVLSKQAGLWYSGIAVGVAGFAVAVTGLMMK